MKILAIIWMTTLAWSSTGDVNKLQKALDQTKGLQAQFAQTIYSDRFGDENASGEIVVQKPNRMRWVYETPNKRVFLADGTTLYRVDPINGVTQSPQEELMKEDIPFDFLWKDVHISKQFDATTVRLKNKRIRYALTPKDEKAQMKKIVMDVSFDPFVVHQIETLDVLDQRNKLEFSQLILNPKLSPNTFDLDTAKKTLEPNP